MKQLLTFRAITLSLFDTKFSASFHVESLASCSFSLFIFTCYIWLQTKHHVSFYCVKYYHCQILVSCFFHYLLQSDSVQDHVFEIFALSKPKIQPLPPLRRPGEANSRRLLGGTRPSLKISKVTITTPLEWATKSRRGRNRNGGVVFGGKTST